MTQKKTQSDPLKEVETLKEAVLKKEETKKYSSERFGQIEKQVKADLARQATDDALKDISIAALVI